MKASSTQPGDVRTKVERHAEISHRLATGLYRPGTLTQLTNDKFALEIELGIKQSGELVCVLGNVREYDFVDREELHNFVTFMIGLGYHYHLEPQGTNVLFYNHN